MTTATLNPPVPEARPESVAPALDAYIPRPDIRERFQVTVRAPAAVVMEVARTLDLQGLPIVRAIFRLRELIMRSPPPPPRVNRGLLAETLGIGWGLLEEQPDRLVVCGAATQPWKADPAFTPIPADRFAGYIEPERMKIAWTLEAEARQPELTVFAHETRAVATDVVARAKFRRYWRWARFGIVSIRLFLMPAVRREAERRWKATRPRDN